MKEELLTTYRDCAIAHGKGTLSGDSKATNKAHDQLLSTLRKLVENQWDDSLAAFLDDENIWVRLWAGAHCLEISEKAAIKTLERIVSSDTSIASMDAEYTLQEWRNGGLRVRKTLG